jgi:O-methyltransferase
MKMHSALEELIKRIFNSMGLEVRKCKKNLLRLSNDVEDFQELFKRTGAHTLVDRDRCFMLYQFVGYANAKEGEMAEIGVYKGGTAKLISKVAVGADKTVHLFDTFSGMPPTDKTKDYHQKGDFSDTSLDRVKKHLADCSNVRFYQGRFPDTAEPIMDVPFCFVHIDVDIYESVMECCKFFHPRLVQGGILLFDDYGFLTCPGAKMAVDQFFSDKSEYPCYLPTGQCFVIKL